MPPDEDRIVTGRLLLGAKMRESRKEAGLHLAELAELAGITQSYLSDIERGNKLPPLPTLDALAAALGTTVSGLLDEVYPWGAATAPARTPNAPPDGRAGRKWRRGASES